MRSTSADLHTLTGAYAVNGLSDTERAMFEVHLARCDSCAVEVAELTATAARLGAAVEFAPPPHLRARVLAAAAKTRQLPPRTARLSRARNLRGAGGLLAAACLVVAVVLTVEVKSTQDSDALAQISSEYSRFSNFLSTPDVKLVSATGPDGATGTAVVSASRDELLFLSRDLPAPPSDRVYQLWLIDDHGPRPAGVLPASGSAPLMASGVADVRKVAITVEPTGGSATPTTAPMMVIALA
ncbi:anti-sigma factor [Lentzea sp. BCCO 10_0856]|uniref:Regulator of SigK n=1 Tax=Lentzea miocenica TaxID=3095431 RepID=A0ABU4T5Z8_9PSEU|nr:anti-sigma factor [Lentzea sp. BCCO 10_0856]MDX8033368.1 anti-sigma factor [Lentzea sp. BCCO 10_0856]